MISNSTDVETLKATFEEKGFLHLRNFFPQELSQNLLQVANYFFYMQGLKAYSGADFFGKEKRLIDYSTLETLDQIVLFLDKTDSSLFKQAQSLISISLPVAAYTIFAPLTELVSYLLNTPPLGLVCESPGFVPNLPQNKRRLYTWHSEQCWLPYRRNFINSWVPLFRPKRELGGTMYVMPGSHQQQNWPFSEYYGYDNETLGDTGHYVQYEIPYSELKNYTEYCIQADPHDLVLFHQNMVHRSEINQSTDVSYILIQRYFDFRRDLTFSANPNQRPYTDSSCKLGRPNVELF